MKKRLIVILKN
jgi:glycine/D-amino acid oxidase-like deaminating enzyme